VIEAQSAEDLVQPDVKRSIRIDGCTCAKSSDEGLLRQIQCVVVVAHQTEGTEVSSLHVPVHQLTEGLGVARLGSNDERSIDSGVVIGHG
jgi:hypothetical protein